MLNRRGPSFAFALVTGVLAVTAVSCACGAKCDATTCDGCCDPSGLCVKAPNNANNTTCGAKGAVCADCRQTSTMCDSTALTCGVSDAGLADAGASCPGCLLPTGVCAPGNTTNNCGVGGVACSSCPVGQLCMQGICAMPNVVRTVGSECSFDSECQASLGATAVCKLVTSSRTASYAGGYCTVPCQNADCPQGSVCVSLDPRYGESDVICWDQCGTGDPCRQPGYNCFKYGNTSACWISPLPTEDAGPPADKVGQPCAQATQCQNPPDRGGVCLTRDLSRQWPDGYCSKSFCSFNSECSPDAGASCVTFASVEGTENRCIQKCGAMGLDGGPADCRQGYLCQSVRQPDGGASQAAYCLPPEAPPPTRTGQACVGTAECSVPSTTIADCLTETSADGGPSGFPGGYCSRLGCRNDSECAPDAGGLCLLAGTKPTCFQRCAVGGQGQSTCRAGYLCIAYSLPLIDGGTGPSADGYCAAPCWSPGNACQSGTCGDAGYCL